MEKIRKDYRRKNFKEREIKWDIIREVKEMGQGPIGVPIIEREGLEGEIIAIKEEINQVADKKNG